MSVAEKYQVAQVALPDIIVCDILKYAVTFCGIHSLFSIFLSSLIKKYVYLDISCK